MFLGPILATKDLMCQVIDTNAVVLVFAALTLIVLFVIDDAQGSGSVRDQVDEASPFQDGDRR